MAGLTDAIDAAMEEMDSGEASPPAEPVESSDASSEPEDTADNVDADVDDDVADEDDGDVDDDDGDVESEEDSAKSAGGDGEQPDAVQVEDEATVRLEDGTELTGKELREGYLRQADYTRKTQQAAKVRKEAQQLIERTRDWWQSVRQDPAGAVTEIASSSGAPPAQTFAEALSKQDVQTATRDAALILRHMADKGRLDPQFVEHFGIQSSGNPVAQQAEQGQTQQELEKLKQEREQEKVQQRRRQMVDEYHRQWDAIKHDEGLELDSEKEKQAKVEVMQFARKHGIADLKTAYAAMAHQGVGFAGEAKKRQAEQRRKQARRSAENAKTQRKKQSAKAQTRRSARAHEPAKGPKGLDGAIAKAAQEVGIPID